MIYVPSLLRRVNLSPPYSVKVSSLTRISSCRTNYDKRTEPKWGGWHSRRLLTCWQLVIDSPDIFFSILINPKEITGIKKMNKCENPQKAIAMMHRWRFNLMNYTSFVWLKFASSSWKDESKRSECTCVCVCVLYVRERPQKKIFSFFHWDWANNCAQVQFALS